MEFHFFRHQVTWFQEIIHIRFLEIKLQLLAIRAVQLIFRFQIILENIPLLELLHMPLMVVVI